MFTSRNADTRTAKNTESPLASALIVNSFICCSVDGSPVSGDAAAGAQVVPRQRGGVGRVCARSASGGEAGAKPTGLLMGGALQSGRARAGSHSPPPLSVSPKTQDKRGER